MRVAPCAVHGAENATAGKLHGSALLSIPPVHLLAVAFGRARNRAAASSLGVLVTRVVGTRLPLTAACRAAVNLRQDLWQNIAPAATTVRTLSSAQLEHLHAMLAEPQLRLQAGRTLCRALPSHATP